IILPFIPLMLGGYCLYASLRSGMVMKISAGKRDTRKLPLRDLESSQQLESFQAFIRKKLCVSA
ncbi:MAG: hypothetical protein ACLFT3_09675, partial [Cyclobacteriaceae bacterium]